MVGPEAEWLEKTCEKWRKDAPEILRGAYRAMTGLAPKGSWSFIMDKSARNLAEMEMHRGVEDTAKFLRESMIGFVLRCGGGYQQEPTSPFFADSYVFSGTALEYLSKNGLRVRKYAWAAADPQQFPVAVYDAFMVSEMEYWSLGMPNTPPPLEVMRPELYWALFSAAFSGRLSFHAPKPPAKRSEATEGEENATDNGNPLGGFGALPLLYTHWTHEIDYMGTFRTLEQAVNAERQRLRGDKQLALVARLAVGRAIWDAAIYTWQRLGLGRVGLDDRGRIALPDSCRAELEAHKFDPEGDQSLWEWELGWRAFLCEKLNLDFDPDEFQRACRVAASSGVGRLSKAANPLASLVGGTDKISDFMKRALADARGED